MKPYKKPKSKTPAHVQEPAVAYMPEAPEIRIRQQGHIVKKVRIDDTQKYFFNTKGTQTFTYKELDPLINFLEWDQQDIAQFLDVNASTVSRWKSQNSNLGSLRSKKIWDIDKIIASGTRIFNSEENFKNWLNTTNYALGDVKPIHLLVNPFTVDSVDNALEALRYGSYI